MNMIILLFLVLIYCKKSEMCFRDGITQVEPEIKDEVLTKQVPIHTTTSSSLKKETKPRIGAVTPKKITSSSEDMIPIDTTTPINKEFLSSTVSSMNKNFFNGAELLSNVAMTTSILIDDTIVCNGVKRSTIGITDPKCCGYYLYDATNSICCQNIIRPISNASLPGCCGINVIDLSKQICCSGVIQTYISNSFECCGTYLYNSAENICCNNILRFKNGQNTQCCGDVPYNPKKAICCQNRLHKIDSNIETAQCCGVNIYNSKKSLCTPEGKLISLQF